MAIVIEPSIQMSTKWLRDMPNGTLFKYGGDVWMKIRTWEKTDNNVFNFRMGETNWLNPEIAYYVLEKGRQIILEQT